MLMPVGPPILLVVTEVQVILGDQRREFISSDTGGVIVALAHVVIELFPEFRMIDPSKQRKNLSAIYISAPGGTDAISHAIGPVQPKFQAVNQFVHPASPFTEAFFSRLK